MKPSFSKSAWLCAAYVVIHAAAHLSARWFEITPGISIWYVPGGLVLALIVLLGPRYIPVAFLANLATAWFPTPPVEMWMVWFFPLLISVTYGGAAVLVKRYLGGRLLPGSARETLGFCLVVGVTPLVVATIGTAVYYNFADASHVMAAADFWPSVINWWIGDASGILTVVPVIMVFVAPWLERGTPTINVRRMDVGTLVQGVIRSLVLLGAISLVLMVPGLREHDAFYICFLPLIWICVHHGVQGATLATLLVMMVGLVSMRLAGTTTQFAHIFLLFELAVSSVGLGLGTMVTRRKETERKLEESRAQLDRVIKGAQLGLWEWNMVSGQVEVNERFVEIVGYRGEEISPIAESWQGLIHPADRARVEAAARDHFEGRSELFEVEFRLRTKAGNWCWLHSRGSIVQRDAAGKPLRVSGTQVDVTDRKRVEAEVGRLLGIIEATPDLIVMVDAAGRVLYANAAMLASCGRSVAGTAGEIRLADVLAGDAGRRVTDEALPVAQAAGVWQGEAVLVDVAGRNLPVSQVVLAHRDEETDTFVFSVIMRDLSHQKRAEAEQRHRDYELLQLQKAESLGVLAGGIAHDFNNLLTVVVGNANLASQDLPKDSSVHAYIAKIHLATAKAAALCQQMLAYAGRNPVAFAEIDLNQLVGDACQLLDPSFRQKIQVRLDLEKPLASSTQLQQVVMNLVLNAAESMGEREGTITVRTRGRRFDAAELKVEFPGKEIEPGAYVLLEVEDTGCGMSPETLVRIFEPFFTTKFTGKGLGLAAVGGLVKSHRGGIAVKSQQGVGTFFWVVLPALVIKAAPVVKAPVGTGRKLIGQGAFLIVDDNVYIRETATHMLANFGFTPLSAADGVEGVEVFRQHAGELVGVLLDLTMPRMDGFEAHAEIHRINPQVPVILMSGFSDKLDNLPPEAIHPAGVLAKPFSMVQLRERLVSVLPHPV